MPDSNRQSDTQALWAVQTNQYRPKFLDGWLLVTVLGMLAFGLVMLFSASMTDAVRTSEGTTFYIRRQILFTVLGLIGMYLFTRIDIRWFNRPKIAWVLYSISTIMLGLVLVPGIGDVRGGARRWFVIPGSSMTFQPSEFTKVALVACLAIYYSWLHKRRNSGAIPRQEGWKGILKDAWWDMWLPGLLALSNILLTFLQPHTSAMIIMVTLTFICMLAAGIRLRSFLVGFGGFLVLLVAGILLLSVMKPLLPESIANRFAHVERRLAVFVSLSEDGAPETDLGLEEASEDDVYQSKQALIAIGSGGVMGEGLGQGKQKYDYLPEGHNDYIFSNIAEELGFVGALVVIGFFVFFLVRGVWVALRTTTNYAQIIATGYTFLITLQAALSIAVNVALIPPTGISLPFFSYGGTSNLFFLLSIGLLLNVSKFNMTDRIRTR